LVIGETLVSILLAAGVTWSALNSPKLQAFLVEVISSQSKANPWPLTLASLGAAVLIAAVTLAVSGLLIRD